MSHPRPEALSQFLLGNLPDKELETLAAHLETCPSCRQALPVEAPADPLVVVLRKLPASSLLAEGSEPFCAEPECGQTLDRLAQSTRLSNSPLDQAETRSFNPSTGPAWVSSRPRGEVFGHLPCEFGRYRIERQLGEGGMGAVYLATDTVLGRAVALKITRFNSSETAEARFRREARAAAALLYEGICPVFDYGVQDGIPFITMAYIEGQSLAQLLRQKEPLDTLKAVDQVRQVALALAEAHRQGILHRDLKPSNIMLDGQGRPKVVDFGLARGEDDLALTHPGETPGTPQYMSPEQVQGQPLTAASDIFSLGVILYQLLAGRLPFAGTSLAQLTYQIVHTDPEPLFPLNPSPRWGEGRVRGSDRRLEEICLKVLAKDPAARFASMDAFAAALQEVLDTPETSQTAPLIPTPVGQDSDPVRPLRWESGLSRNLRWVLAASLAGFLLLLISVLWLAFFNGTEDPPKNGPLTPGPLEVGKTKTYRTIAQALAQAQEGDVIELCDASHVESLIITPGNFRPGQPGAPIPTGITIQTKPGATVVWSPASKDPKTPLLHLNQAKNFHLKGKNLTLDGTIDAAKNLRVQTLLFLSMHSPGMTLEDAHLQGFDKWGVHIMNCHGLAERPVRLAQLHIRGPKAEAGIFFDANDKIIPPFNDFIEIEGCQFPGLDVHQAVTRKNTSVTGQNIRADTTIPVSLPPMLGQIDLLIFEKDNPRRQNLRLRHEGALPLKLNDLIRIEANVKRPAYLYLLWIEADRSVQPIYPWKPGHWDDRPKVENPVKQLRFPPAQGDGYSQKPGLAGMETLVLLARETPLPRDIDLSALLGELPRQSRQDARSAVWFENFQVTSGDRGPNFFDVRRLDDPVLETQRLLKDRLGRHFSYSAAVSFANLAK